MKTETKKPKHRITRSLILMLVGALFVLGIQAGLRFKEYDDKYVRVYDSSYGLLIQELKRESDIFEIDDDDISKNGKVEVVVFRNSATDVLARLNLTIYLSNGQKYVRYKDVKDYIVVY